MTRKDRLPISFDAIVLVLEIAGRRHLYAVPVSYLGTRDPQELTMGEWRKFPELSARAMLADLLSRRRGGKAVTA